MCKTIAENQRAAAKQRAAEKLAMQQRAQELPQRDYVYMQTRAWTTDKDVKGVHAFKLRITAAEVREDHIAFDVVEVLEETGRPRGMKHPMKASKQVFLFDIPALIASGVVTPV